MACVQFTAGELWVVSMIHALVAKVFAYLKHSLQSANQQLFEIKFRSDSQEKLHVEFMEVCLKGFLEVSN